MKTIEVLVPVAEAKYGETAMAQRPQDLNGKAVGFVWNHKPNGDLLLRNVEQALKEKFRLSGTMMKTKPRASSPTPLEDLEELSANCELVILGVGD
jgi:hypothetical protein